MKCREPAHSIKTVWYNALSAVTVSEENVDCEDERIHFRATASETCKGRL
jgi:hypothetical protein